MQQSHDKISCVVRVGVAICNGRAEPAQERNLPQSISGAVLPVGAPEGGGAGQHSPAPPRLLGPTQASI
jgi:hypothetical protein